jgi:hypothetical protein
MADSKQSSDSAQTGPGTKATNFKPKSPYTPAPSSVGGKNGSGSSQGTQRGNGP